MIRQIIAWNIALVSWVGGTALATQDGSISVEYIDLEQSINLEQSDATGAQHVSSSLSVFVDLYDGELAAPLEPNPEISLPSGATGSIPKTDFVVDGHQASYFFESAEDDSLLRFPTGEIGFVLRANDGSCVAEQSFRRESFFSEGIGISTTRPNIRNIDGWKDGKLCLPKKALVIRWDRMGMQYILEGDSQQENQISVFDNGTDERVFQSRIGTVYEFPEFSDYAMYPHLLLGDQGGIDLSKVPGIVEGKTYTVTLSKTRQQIYVGGDMEVDSILRSQVSFQLYVDPLATVPPRPILNIATDDETQMLTISWDPDPNFYHVVLDDFDVTPLGLDSGDESIQTLFTTPQNAGEKHVFTDQMMGTRGYYRVLPVPR